MRIADSAHKHGFTASEISHAFGNAHGWDETDGSQGDEAIMAIGLTPDGVMIEILAVVTDEDEFVIVHAMRASAYWRNRILGA